MSYIIRLTRAPSCKHRTTPPNALRPYSNSQIANHWLPKPIPQRSVSTRPDVPRPAAKSSSAARAAFSSTTTRRTIPRGDSSLNTADQIEDRLREDGHLIWGFAVYRCTYRDDAAWETCLGRLNASIRKSMRFYNGLDLLNEDAFRLTVFDNASELDGVGASVVRRHFREWRKGALREEQGTREEIEARRGKVISPHHPDGVVGVDEESRARSPAEVQDVAVQPRGDDIRRPWSGHGYGHRIAAVRYRLCVAVDEAALQSVVSAKGESRIGEAWMNLIEGDWTPEDAAAQREETKIQYLENGLDLEDWDDEVKIFPEIDGCTEENVGWMEVCYQDLVPLLYSSLMDINAFEELYVRPPGIRGW
jgi:hypothetical protein